MARKPIGNHMPLPVRQALKELGMLIASGRKERRFTQAELANRVGVGRMTIVRMEQGAPEIAIGYYLTAAWILGLPVLSWCDFAGLHVDSSVAVFLEKLSKHLPERIRTKKDDIDNDF
ncbi:MAG: helix-turn-helix domain-containing protein [Deltaproteobacteria bacterium]|nr:helix-turn-helix domain-containing protein [Deltaproteobacteria bacterium]